MTDDDPPVDFTLLIPELPTWNGGQGIDVSGWLSGVGSYEHAIAYAQLFWPTFVIHEDCVLFANFVESSFRGFAQQAQGEERTIDKRAIESVMNHVHLVDLFPCSERAPTRAQLVHLGRMLKGMWACKLRRDFPERNVVVSFHEEGIEDLLDYQVTFYQADPRMDAAR